MPLTRPCLLEHQHIVARRSRFEAEHLYQRSRQPLCGSLAEMQACLYDARVVHHHKRPLGQHVRQLAESVLADVGATHD